TSAPGTDSMTRVPLSGSTKSLAVVPSRTAQSGAPVITASTCALSKLKLLSVSRPGGGGPKCQANGVHGYSTGAGAATAAGGGAGATIATGGGGGGAVSATGGGSDGGGAATWAGGGGQAQ